MTDRLVIDLGDDGQFSVGMWPDGQTPQFLGSRELAWPLGGDVLEELRWYLEDYLRVPFGVYKDRGSRVEAALAGWGQAVFSAVFGDSRARDLYVAARACQRPVELVLRSASLALLRLPWELLAEPGRPTPLAISMTGLNRSLPVMDSAQTVPLSGGRLRVLMVISRPAGTADVGYRMVARPLVDRLGTAGRNVDLVVLRPPTLEALQAELSAAEETGRPFQVVHFDGHGALPESAADVSSPGGAAGAGGVLAFEKPGGGSDPVSASKLAQVLAAAKVTVVVLNACQSGAVGKDVEAAVATCLLAEGIASVVAMAYNVYAVAAAEFMGAFYERLFAGETVTGAVTAGRQRLYRQNKRPSPGGELPLADWLVPVHYWRRDVSFPQAGAARGAGLPSLDQLLDAQDASESAPGTGDLDPVGSFVGRDDLFYQLELAVRLQKVVILHGPGGVGKTELAKAFGRWWRDTGGVDRPEWVFWHSFEPGMAVPDLDSVVMKIGLRRFGSDFARLEPKKRRMVVQSELAERRMLLIWDNFETVWSMPDPAGATKPLDETSRGELRAFIEGVIARGRSSVLITSRAQERWLGHVRRIAVGGLTPQEAGEYADSLLAAYPSAWPRRGRPAFAELMAWLNGHPLSMRLVLPLLDATEPEELLDGLRRTVPLPAGQDAEDEEGRTTSLAASIRYSIAHLAGSSRGLLPALSLFHTVADAEVLGIFSADRRAPARFRDATRRDWEKALDTAARVGLLVSLGSGRYRLHPVLPGFLASWWRSEEADEAEAAADAATRALLAAHGLYGSRLHRQITRGDAALGYAIIGLEQRTFSILLGYALRHSVWSDAQLVAGPLYEYWYARGLDKEARAWADRALAATEGPDGTPPSLDTPAGGLWLFITGTQAARDHELHHLDDAEGAYRLILAALSGQPSSPLQQSRLAATYHQLGLVTESQWELDDAARWYRKSLELKEQLGDQHGLVAAFNQLGSIAFLRGQLDEAVTWYEKSRLLDEQLGNTAATSTIYHQLGLIAQAQRRLDDAEQAYLRSLAGERQTQRPVILASNYHQLGVVAHERRQLDEAEDWYNRSLAVSERSGYKPGLAVTYRQIGLLARHRDRLGEAEEWYRKSLDIDRQLGIKAGVAASYHELGNIAYLRRQLDEAESLYSKALAIRQELGDRQGLAPLLGQLGLLAEAQHNPLQALEWTVRCVTLFSEFPHPLMGSAPQQLGRLASRVGGGALEDCWRRVTGGPLPAAVRASINSPEHEGTSNDA